MTAIENSGKNKTTRILLVDDHPVVRDGFAEVINREPDLNVCAAAERKLLMVRSTQLWFLTASK